MNEFAAKVPHGDWRYLISCDYLLSNLHDILVKAVNDGQMCPVWPARKWVEEAGDQMRRSQFSLAYIPRSCNLAADWIAKSAVKGLLWGSHDVAPPTPLYLLCLSDFCSSSRYPVREGIG